MDETTKAVYRRNTTATWWPAAVSAASDRQMTFILEAQPVSRGIQLYVVMGFLSLMSVVGTAGNALVLCVFFRKRKEMAVSTLLIIVLAVVDFVTCLVVIPYTVYMESVDFRVQSDISCKVYQFLITSNIPFSALIMVLIAVDRYLCICHPFLRLLTVARAKGVIATLGLFAAALGLCVSLIFGVYQRKLETFTPVEQGSHPTGTFEHGPLSGSWALADFVSVGSRVLSTTTVPGNSEGTVQKQSWETSSRSSVAHYESPAQPDPLNPATGWPARETTVSALNDGSTRAHGYFLNMGRTPFLDSFSMVSREFLVKKTDGIQSTVESSSGTDDGLGQLENKGHCESNDLLISVDFQFYYQKLYTAMYPVCLGIVIILYVLIYHSVLKRRSRRQEQKSKTMAVVRSLNSVTTRNRVESDNSHRTETLPSNEDVNDQAEIEPIMQQESDVAKERWQGKQLNQISKAESTRLANLKTAAMLFVVTVVFVVTFLPAFLMVLELVPNNVIVFYLYFANNVANPVIYSFMNQNFRNDLLKLFKSHR